MLSKEVSPARLGKQASLRKQDGQRPRSGDVRRGLSELQSHTKPGCYFSKLCSGNLRKMSMGKKNACISKTSAQ